MRTLLVIAAFELKTRLKRLSTWVYFAVFFALAMLWTAAAGGVFSNANVVFGSGKVWINSPYAISQTVAFLGMAGLTVIAALAGRAVQQDFEYRTEAFFFTAPIRKWQYLAGRYAGALAALLIVFASIALGVYCGTLLPAIDTDRLGPSHLAAYVAPYATVLLPNLVFVGGAFFCLAALTRRMLPVYLGSALCLIGYLAAQALIRDIDNKTLAALIDPFGVSAAARLTEYWTIAERNTRLVPFEGVLLWNRLLWIAVGGLLVLVCYRRFSFAERSIARKAEQADLLPVPARTVPWNVTPQAPVPLRLLPGMTWLYFRETVRNVYFVVFALAGVAFVIASSTTLGSIYGTNTWPVTYQIRGLLEGSFGLFMLIIITFYAGELAWRERDHRIDQIVDALPVPTWLPFASKLGALLLVPVLLECLLLACGIGIQTAKGYYRYELPVYLHELFTVDLVNYWLICALALAVHSVIDQKYLGHFVMIVYYLASVTLPMFGFEHNLYRYAGDVGYQYSDMNGYGQYLPRLRWFQSYYAGWAAVMLVIAYLLWTRGTLSGWRDRLRAARDRATLPVRAVAGVSIVAMAGLGGFIFYNTNVLNRYVTAHDQEQRQADYEKRYKPLADDPQPKITAVKVTVDLFPEEQRVRMRGRYALVNRNDVPVKNVHLFFPLAEKLVVNRLAFDPPGRLATGDERIGLRSYALAAPLAPGATANLDFDVEVPTRGFENARSNTTVVENGTFVNGNFALPMIGYDERGELVTDRDRKKYGLAPKERMRDRDDPRGLQFNYITHQADWITFEAEVVTDADQIAVAPGYLQREWTEGGRRHFVYAMDSPILDFFAFQSARYAVKRDRWHDVAIEVYYQPGHEFNLDRMIASVKDSLDYYTTHFSPYQHRQFRILEFPRYQQFAQSFPNTIPYSEAIGFIARVRENDPDDIDYPYYVTAHEAAHQWWAHQVIGGDVQGATMLSETLAQYSALMVMKKKYGAAKMQRFLRYELDRYLTGRALEQKKELPLARVEDQPYIHYRKGSLVMYALADYIGEDNVDSALRALIRDTAFKGPPYPNTSALLQRLRAVTPPKYQYLYDDWFDSITLYDNRATSAQATRRTDGKYDVRMHIVARKLKADALGKESDAALDDWIDIGVLDADGNPLGLEKHHFTSAESDVTLVVDGKPVRAGIDPLNELIDRKPKDNMVAVEIR